MICGVCGTNNPDGATTCASCGSPLQAANGAPQGGYPQGGYPQGGYPGQQPVYPGQPVYGAGGNVPIQKREIVTALILSIVTCGIYGIIWFVKLTDDTNVVSGDPNATSGGMAFLLTLITCGIYGYYWAYKRGEILDNYNVSRGLPKSSNAVLYLVLQLFGLGIVAYCLMQSELNKIAQGA